MKKRDGQLLLSFLSSIALSLSLSLFLKAKLYSAKISQEIVWTLSTDDPKSGQENCGPFFGLANVITSSIEETTEDKPNSTQAGPCPLLHSKHDSGTGKLPPIIKYTSLSLINPFKRDICVETHCLRPTWAYPGPVPSGTSMYMCILF